MVRHLNSEHASFIASQIWDGNVATSTRKAIALIKEAQVQCDVENKKIEDQENREASGN